MFDDDHSAQPLLAAFANQVVQGGNPGVPSTPDRAQTYCTHVLVAGTRLATRNGDCLVQDLRPGDQVLTRQNGFQAVIASKIEALCRTALVKVPRLTPVLVGQGALEASLPTQDLRLFAMTEVVVDRPSDHDRPTRATDMVGHHRIARIFPDGVSYVMLALPHGSSVFAEGVWLLPLPETALHPFAPQEVDRPDRGWQKLADAVPNWTN
jgi:Hint domain